MPAWLPIAISAGSQLLGGLLGGGKQKTSYQPSAQEMELYNMVMGQMRGPTPGYITDPIKSRFAGIRENIREGTTQALGPLSGLQTSQLIKASGAENQQLGHARQGYMDQLRSLLASVTPRGSQVTTKSTDWGGVMGGIGGDVLESMGYENTMKQLQGLFGGGTTSAGGGQSPNPSQQGGAQLGGLIGGIGNIGGDVLGKLGSLFGLGGDGASLPEEWKRSPFRFRPQQNNQFGFGGRR